MRRRCLLQAAAAVPTLPFALPAAASSFARVRPGDPAWPSRAYWAALDREVGGRLIEVRPPVAGCLDEPSGDACAQLFRELKILSSSATSPA
jgi:hypothetical protein